MIEDIIKKINITRMATFLISVVFVYALLNIIFTNDLRVIFEDFEPKNIKHFIDNKFIDENEQIVAYKNLDRFDNRYALIVTDNKVHIINKNYNKVILLSEIIEIELKRLVVASIITIKTNRFNIQVQVNNGSIEEFIKSLKINHNKIKIID